MKVREAKDGRDSGSEEKYMVGRGEGGGVD